jgi:hypothetical protein
MALIVETGEGLQNSESLVDLAFLRDFAVSRGYTLPADDATLEQQLRAAHDYLLSIEPQLKGCRAVAGQALPFPRKGVYFDNVEQPYAVIPTTLKNAICQLVVEAQARDILPSADGRVVVSETVGPISTTYQNSVSSPSFPRVEAFLAILLKAGSGGLQAIRV